MIRRKGVVMYIALFFMGLLLILASQVVRPRGDEKARAELVALIADAESVRAESQSLLGRVKTASTGNPSLLPELLSHETHFESVDTRINELEDWPWEPMCAGSACSPVATRSIFRISPPVRAIVSSRPAGSDARNGASLASFPLLDSPGRSASTDPH